MKPTSLVVIMEGGRVIGWQAATELSAGHGARLVAAPGQTHHVVAMAPPERFANAAEREHFVAELARHVKT